MNFDYLEKGMGVKDALSYGQMAAQNQEMFSALFEIAIGSLDKQSDKAAWIIYKAVLECDCAFAQQYMEPLLHALIERNLTPAAQRELLKVLLSLKPQKADRFGQLFDRAQAWMFDVNAEAAIRYAALNVIELAGKTYPEMIPECWEIIQDAKALAEGPWQRRCKKVQEGLNRKYQKWNEKKG
jgi:hypothetical protein